MNKITKKTDLKLNNNNNNNYKTNNLNNDSVASYSSIHSIRNNRNYNKTYQLKSKVSKKINNIYNTPKIKIDRSSKSLIKIRKNSPKKRKDIKENELPIYKGDIDYNEVSLKDFNETVDNLIKKYIRNGFTYSKKGFGKFEIYNLLI